LPLRANALRCSKRHVFCPATRIIFGITKWYRFSQFNNRLVSLAEPAEVRKMIYCGMESEKTNKKSAMGGV
ncbi:hypothetical protein, partial [Dickeya dadantii]|uniref:hypothetical protein n=1 Tax=Dickeya dadantii TaxID=204038 RepID=UPI001C3756DF